jgi:hypothetical protein
MVGVYLAPQFVNRRKPAEFRASCAIEPETVRKLGQTAALTLIPAAGSVASERFIVTLMSPSYKVVKAPATNPAVAKAD